MLRFRVSKRPSNWFTSVREPKGGFEWVPAISTTPRARKWGGIAWVWVPESARLWEARAFSSCARGGNVTLIELVFTFSSTAFTRRSTVDVRREEEENKEKKRNNEDGQGMRHEGKEVRA
jgi:hypothetical protein